MNVILYIQGKRRLLQNIGRYRENRLIPPYSGSACPQFDLAAHRLDIAAGDYIFSVFFMQIRSNALPSTVRVQSVSSTRKSRVR